ncbi:hypothetical protein [Streptomyces longispororuber]|nr:hypothetical protein [Streptomyces longispororuber]
MIEQRIARIRSIWAVLGHLVAEYADLGPLTRAVRQELDSE